MKAIGIDAVEIERIAETLERHGQQFRDKVCTEAEQALLLQQESAVEFFGGRFAAKEAVLKVLGTGWAKGLGFRDIEILRDPDGRPHVVLHRLAAERAAVLGIREIHVSITHTRRDVMAVAAAD